MGCEYKIRFTVPKDYDPSALFRRLPSPIHRSTMTEVYNYKIEQDGFYFVDHLVDNTVASIALKQFINEALRLSNDIHIFEP